MSDIILQRQEGPIKRLIHFWITPQAVVQFVPAAWSEELFECGIFRIYQPITEADTYRTMQDIIPQDLINVMLEYLPKYMTIMVQSFEEMTPEEVNEMMEHDLFEDDRLFRSYQKHLTPDTMAIALAYRGEPVPDDIKISRKMVRAAAFGVASAEYLMGMLEECLESYKFKVGWAGEMHTTMYIAARTLLDKRAYRVICDLLRDDGPWFMYLHNDRPHAPVALVSINEPSFLADFRDSVMEQVLMSSDAVVFDMVMQLKGLFENFSWAIMYHLIEHPSGDMLKVFMKRVKPSSVNSDELDTYNQVRDMALRYM